MIGTSVGKENFKKYANEIISVMIEIQKGTGQDNDPQKSYLLSGWQRICLILQEEFIPYLELILPSLFSMSESILKPRTEDDEDDGDIDEDDHTVFYDVTKEDKKKRATDQKNNRTKEINTFETDEAEIALNMLAVFINELKRGYLPYVDKTIDLVLPILNYSNNEGIRKSAAKCLPGLIDVIKFADLQGRDELLLKAMHLFMEKLWAAVENEADPAMIIIQIQVIRECIDKVGRYMDIKEIEEMSLKILRTLEDSDLRKAENEKYKVQDDVEDDEILAVDEESDKEEELQVELAQLIGFLFKTHKELTLPLVEIIYTKVLSKVLQPGVSDKMHKFGLFLVVDMIEFLGIELIPDKWPHLSEALLSFATDKNCLVRQASVYGIGVLAEKSKEAYTLMSEICLKKLLEALNMPQSDDSDKKHGYAKDNVVSSLGKIIKYHSDKVNLTEIITLWLDNLPLTWDKPEGILQHEFLVDVILTGNSSLVLGENYSKLPKVIEIFSEIIDTKVCNANIKEKISTVLKFLLSDQTAAGIVEKCAVQMSDIQKRRLKEVIQS